VSAEPAPAPAPRRKGARRIVEIPRAVLRADRRRERLFERLATHRSDRVRSLVAYSVTADEELALAKRLAVRSARRRLLEPVRSDPSDYVRRSVGNWLNDASKSRPEWVRSLAAEWRRASKTAETAWIVRHALRTLRKGGG